MMAIIMFSAVNVSAAALKITKATLDSGEETIMFYGEFCPTPEAYQGNDSGGLTELAIVASSSNQVEAAIAHVTPATYKFYVKCYRLQFRGIDVAIGEGFGQGGGGTGDDVVDCSDPVNADHFDCQDYIP